MKNLPFCRNIVNVDITCFFIYIFNSRSAFFNFTSFWIRIILNFFIIVCHSIFYDFLIFVFLSIIISTFICFWSVFYIFFNFVTFSIIILNNNISLFRSNRCINNFVEQIVIGCNNRFSINRFLTCQHRRSSFFYFSNCR